MEGRKKRLTQYATNLFMCVDLRRLYVKSVILTCMMHLRSYSKASVCFHLWTCPSILDLAGVEALLLRVFHAGIDTRAAEAHRVDGTLIVKQRPVCDYLKSSQEDQIQ